MTGSLVEKMARATTLAALLALGCEPAHVHVGGDTPDAHAPAPHSAGGTSGSARPDPTGGAGPGAPASDGLPDAEAPAIGGPPADPMLVPDAGAIAAPTPTSPPAPADAAPADPATAVTAGALLALTGGCTIPASHAYKSNDGTSTTICALAGAVFWKAGMNIDCDGRATAGKCDAKTAPDYFPETAFHNAAGASLAAAVTPYVVIPEDFVFPGLDGKKGGNVVAVVYQDKVAFAVWGDTGDPKLIGEGSYALAKKLGIDPNPDTGGVEGHDVTYIVFDGAGAVPHDLENRSETETLGARLASELVTSNK